jgi:hypothetical protein
MNAVSMLIAAVVILPAVGLVAWAWFAMNQVEQELRSFTGFDGLHFEICRGNRTTMRKPFFTNEPHGSLRRWSRSTTLA